MTQVSVKHAFHSAKADSPDTTLVNPSNWNADEVFSAGVNGQLVVRDTGVANGASYVDGPVVGNSSSSYNGSSPSALLAAQNITFTSNGALLLILSAAVITSDGSTPTLRIYRNAVQQATPVFGGTGIWGTYALTFNETPGTYTYNVQIIAVGSATIVSATVQLTSLKIGKV